MAMISTARSRKERRNLYERLQKIDIIGKIEPLMQASMYVPRIEDGKLVRRATGMAYNTPWVFVKTLERRCDLAHNIFMPYLQFIPSFCQSCWKVVVRPRTVVELFNLYELMKHLDLESKCGIEPRPSVDGLYGGYFYCISKAQGLKRYKLVREHINDWLAPEVKVILKRYCTEFEHKFGPSDETKKLTKEQKFQEDYFCRFMPFEGVGHPQPEFLQAFVMLEWIRFAFKSGDPTYSELTGGKSLYDPLVTYHEEVKKDAKL